MKNLFPLAACLIALALAGCSSSPAPSQGAYEPMAVMAPEQSGTKIENIDAARAKALFDQRQDLIVLDVRTPEEYAAGHIPGALNVNFNGSDFAERVQQLDKNKPYLVHCRSGGRSTRSLETLKAEGFQMIYHLDGGLRGWESQGSPTVPSGN